MCSDPAVTIHWISFDNLSCRSLLTWFLLTEVRKETLTRVFPSEATGDLWAQWRRAQAHMLGLQYMAGVCVYGYHAESISLFASYDLVEIS